VLTRWSAPQGATMIEWRKHMDDRIMFDAAWTKMGLHHGVPQPLPLAAFRFFTLDGWVGLREVFRPRLPGGSCFFLQQLFLPFMKTDRRSAAPRAGNIDFPLVVPCDVARRSVSMRGPATIIRSV
jgi:hypothetical protein